MIQKPKVTSGTLLGVVSAALFIHQSFISRGLNSLG
jgi:hypothetical protein